MNIGSVLKRLRQYKGVTQEKVASFLNLERSSYAKLERNKTMLRLNLAKEIADFYGLELHYFILCIEHDSYLRNNTTVRLVSLQKEKERNCIAA